ncbi:MAG: hypothetical protein AAF387_07330 [Pseudomonadota bacterium]
MASKLGSGDVLPAFSLQTVNDGSVTVPGDMTADFGVVLFYRGHW